MKPMYRRPWEGITRGNFQYILVAGGQVEPGISLFGRVNYHHPHLPDLHCFSPSKSDVVDSFIKKTGRFSAFLYHIKNIFKLVFITYS